MVGFLHPRTSKVFEADVETHTTGEECITGLIQAGFIEVAPAERPYSMTVTRTQKQFLPAMRMQDVGAQAGEQFSIQQVERGAAR